MSVTVHTKPTSVMGRIVGTLFFSVFGLMGLLFCFLLLREVYENARTYAWQKVECVILESKVIEGSGSSPYSFAVKYQYSWSGKEYSSERFSREKTTYSEFTKARRLVEKFKPDSRSICYVNEENPSESVLQRQSLWFVLFLFIPLIFVVVGFGGVYAMWRRKETTPLTSAPVTKKTGEVWGSRGLVLFFLVFFLAGSATAWFLGIRPGLKILQARAWAPTPCTVVSSRVQAHSGDGTTYSVDILYSYQVRGQEYRSSQYDFMPGSSSGYKSKAKIVAQFPPGKRATCYVNPSDPLEAVLHRGFSKMMWVGILFPLPFLAVGLGGLVFTVRKSHRGESVTARANRKWGNKEVRFPMNNASDTSSNASTDALVLRPKSSRIGTLIGVIVFAAFWNGIISVFVWQVIQSWARHRPEYLLTLFMIPFLLVGLGLIFAIFYQFLALFNPRVQVTVRPGLPRLGDTLDIQWQVSGSTGRIRKLRIFLEGREEVTYRRGTSTATDKNIFATFDIANVESSGNMGSGWSQLRIPADTMHTLTSPNNKIIWAIQVHGDIPRWPDVKQEHPLTVTPVPMTTAKSV